MISTMRLAATGLPVEDEIDHIRRALADHGRAVLQAEPGAGKTTVVPLRLLDEQWLRGRRIVMLEPRRVAARAAARRMAGLLGEEPGDTVGWITRDDRRIGPRTRIEVVTEGVLTSQLVDDPGLDGVGLVIFDEFHERSLPGDVGFALTLHSRRHHGLDARLLVMSATIDDRQLARALGDGESPAPAISSPGRTFPVEVLWRPRKKRDRLEAVVARAVREALAGAGDVLVFLPGVAEIRRTARLLRGELGSGVAEVTELHGSLPSDEQDRALRASPHGRRVVLATDLAETSLTVQGVGAVVDSGLAREPRFDPRTAMTRLTTVPASRASGEQRAGRAGREGPGVAIRLWSKVHHGTRRPFRSPSILEVDLAGVVLELARRGITDPAEVPFLDPPPADTWNAAVGLLTTLGALDTAGRATRIGTAMASVPTHPRLARMVVSPRHPWLGCLVAAALDERDL
ncbi:MAG: helicase-related protein, partial [Acidimicrobiales bacterium]